MATPLPPSQWTRVRLSPGSTHPEEEAQLRQLRRAQRQRWEEAVASAPRVRAFKARIETEWLPSMNKDIGEAEAAEAEAMRRLQLKIVREQSYQVLENAGTPVVFVSKEDQENDVDLRLARIRLDALKQGRRRLVEQLDAANQSLNIAAHQPPPPEA